MPRPSGNLSGLRGSISQYIPPLGSVRIQSAKNIHSAKNVHSAKDIQSTKDKLIKQDVSAENI